MAFNNETFGEWEQSVRGQKVLHVISPVSVFISITTLSADFDKFNVVNLMKIVTATLVLEKILANSQQVVEISIEKKRGIKQEMLIFIQPE